MRKNETLVLVGEAVPSDQIDAGEARARLERAQADLERAQAGEGDIYRAEREAKFAEVLVRVSIPVLTRAGYLLFTTSVLAIMSCKPCFLDVNAIMMTPISRVRTDRIFAK